jgi:hypothetical protein
MRQPLKLKPVSIDVIKVAFAREKEKPPSQDVEDVLQVESG